jgi:uncharacterized protein
MKSGLESLTPSFYHGAAIPIPLTTNSDIYYMTKITIEHHPSEERLKELGVATWEIWEKEVSQFPIDFDETETAYVLEGEIIVTPAGGDPVRIVPGDLVSFHAGLDSQWEVVKPLRKHYSYDFPNGV